MKRNLFFLGLLLASCADDPNPQLSDFQSWLDEQYVASFKAGDVDTWVQVFDEDVVALHNTVPAFLGHQGVRQFGGFVSQNVTVEDMAVSLDGMRSHGDWVLTWGTYESRLTLKQSGEAMPGHNPNGKVLFLWEEQSDGRWLILADMGNELPRAQTK